MSPYAVTRCEGLPWTMDISWRTFTSACSIRTRFHGFRDLCPDPVTDEIVENYLEAVRDYPSSDLETRGTVPEELLKRLGEIGFFGLSIPADYGGAGLTLLQYLTVVERIAGEDMALAILCLAHLSIGVKGIVLFGNEEQKRKYLVPAASGDMVFSYALTEPKTGSDARHIETSAALSEDGTHYILNGQKTYITNANYAGGLTVFAQLDPTGPGFMGAFVVETAWEGVSIGKDMPKMGLKASSTATIGFRDVRVPRENLLGEPGDGFKIAMNILNYGRMALGAASSGMMNRSLEDMRARSAGRTQFGVPIREFELIQEKMVRARVNSYVASAMTAFTAGMLMDDPLASVAMESSHCKLFGTTRAWESLYDALQTAGGAGYLATHPYEKRMRDFRVATVFEGTTEIHSIYPPLYMVRTLGKRLKRMGGRNTARVLFLIRGMVGRTRWHPDTRGKVMARAARLVRRNARKIRWALHGGLLRYGTAIRHEEFFLRRITVLSMYLYGALCSTARIEARRRKGEDVTGDLVLLEYFVEEGRLAGRHMGRLFSPRLEKLHQRVMEVIAS